MDASFVKAPLAVPKLSGFDKSHQNIFTAKVGTIVPAMVDELIPGSRVKLKLALSASLPPLASDTFMRCSVKAEAFFCPTRLLVGSYEAWFTDETKKLIKNFTTNAPIVPNYMDKRGYMPIIKDTSTSGDIPAQFAPFNTVGSLPDYLGYRAANPNFIRQKGVTALPFLAYHRIYTDWYRNSLIQRECFMPYDLSDHSSSNGAAVSPFNFVTDDNYIWNTIPKLTLADGASLLSLRQRNFGLDYFTTATPTPQQNSAEVVSFDTSGSTGQFSIAALRAANSLQQFKERNQLLGNLFVEQLYGRYGVRPSDGIAQRSLYLGRGEFEVYSKGIFQATNNTSSGTSDPSSASSGRNPFSSVGARFGNAYASGESFIVDFEAKEPGYLFVMTTLVPRVTYSTGVDRMLTRYLGDGSLVDMANPILQNTGPDAIYQYEVGMTTSSTDIFGYTDKYGSFKTKQDSLHGLLRDGQSLQAFALQRSIGSGSNVISNAFLQIPTDYMDQVTVANAALSDYGVWIDSYFDYKVSMPLSKYSLPSLQDPAYEHGKTIIVNKGGSKL